MTEAPFTPSTPTVTTTRPVSDSTRSHMLAGLATFALLAGGLGGWASTAELTGAVIAQGTVVVESSVKKVQHPTGGIVGRILVSEGDKVAAGDLVMRLDDTITRANLQIVTGQLAELAVRKARLTAERAGADRMTPPAQLAGRTDTALMREIIAGELALFQSRRTARAGQKAQLKERIAQLHQEIEGLDAQRQAKGQEIALIGKELVGLHTLLKRNLVPTIRVTALERESARLVGERAQLIAAAAQARGKIAEIGLQIIQIDQDLNSEVIKELRDIQAKQAELEERYVAAEDQLNRIDILSPHSGIVHQLSVHTVGGVISQGEPVMLIVPEGDALVIEARIAPQDIDHVQLGQFAFIRFPAFNQRTTPEFAGEVVRVAADLTKDQQTGASYFIARIALGEAELKQMGKLKLRPGMPAEVQIRTGERTALTYLTKPLTDQIARAFKEQ